MRGAVWGGVLGMLVAVSTVSTARAQAVSEEEASASDAEARGLFLAGTSAFDAARYTDALRYFQQAYALSGRYALLYNIAITADRLRLDQEALDAFEGFLRDAPADAPRRQEVQTRVDLLRNALAERAAQASPRPIDTAVPATTTPPGGGGDVLGPAITIGAGGAALIAGAIFVGVGQSEAGVVSGAAEGTPWPDVAGAADNASWMTTTGVVLLVVGTAAAAAGVIWLVLTPGGEPEQAGARIEIGVGPGGLAIRGAM